MNRIKLLLGTLFNCIIVFSCVVAADEPNVRQAERASVPFVVVDVPLLYEIGIEADFDRVVVVWCRRESQLRRATERGMARSDAEARLDAQMSLDEKRDRADDVIDSETSLVATEEQARRLLDRMRA